MAHSGRTEIDFEYKKRVIRFIIFFYNFLTFNCLYIGFYCGSNIELYKLPEITSVALLDIKVHYMLHGFMNYNGNGDDGQ